MIESSSLSDTIVEDCAERIRRGASLQECLSAYPALAQELEPLLTMAMQARTLPVPQLRPEVRARARRQMLQAVRARKPKQQRWFSSPILRFALAFAAAFFAMGSGLAAAQTSLPDSPLYGVKRASEEVRLQLTSDPTARASLYLQYSETRFNEIVALSRSGRVVPNSILADYAAQGDLALQTMATLAPSMATPLYQRYVTITERRITVLSESALAESVVNQPALEQLLVHEQAALQAAQQKPVIDDKGTPDPRKPAATAIIPDQTPTPSSDDPDRNPAEPTAKPEPGNDGSPGKPTAKPEPGNDGSPGKPTAKPEPGNDGSPGKPTAKPEPGNDSSPGKPTAKPEPGNDGSPGKPTAQPEPAATTQPEPGNTENPTTQPDPGNSGNNGQPTAQPEPGNSGDAGNNGDNGNAAPSDSGNSGNNGNSSNNGNNGDNNGNDPVNEDKGGEDKGKKP